MKKLGKNFLPNWKNKLGADICLLSDEVLLMYFQQ